MTPLPSAHKAKTKTVIVALQESVRRKKIEKIIRYQGKLQFDETREKNRHAR
jgi:ribosomal protein S17